MLWCCLKCRKNAESKNLRIAETKIGKPIFLSKCACAIRENWENKRASGWCSSLVLKTALSQIPLLD